MLTRQERNAFFLLALVTIAVVTGAIIIESIGKSTLSTQYTSASPDGSLVLLEGTVDRLVVTKNGADQILNVNGTTVFIPASSARGVSLKKGDVVQLYGVVQTYHGEKEILIQQPGDIRLLEMADVVIPGSNGYTTHG
jgi:DNA/RNA endonuclease YhcR with UshA esterase domain